jgi:hypothetical protein
LYTAQPTTKTSGDGIIYTCATGIGAITPGFQAGMYNTCKNQLTVYGNFVADQVKLMRTFGSLRDETPTTTGGSGSLGATTPSEPPQPRPVPQYNYACTSSGETYYTGGSGGNSTPGSGTADCLPGDTSHGYFASFPGTEYNVPCEVTSNSTYIYIINPSFGTQSCPTGTTVASGASSGSLTTNGADWSSCTGPTGFPCVNTGSSVYDDTNYSVTYPVNATPPGADYHLTLNYSNNNAGAWPPPAPSDGNTPFAYNVDVYVNGTLVKSNWQLPSGSSAGSATTDLGALRANSSITLTWNNNGWISPVTGIPGSTVTPYDPNLQINSLSVSSPATPGTPASAASCSNSAGAFWNPSLTPHTCAAEVFDFSPELYLSSPAIAPTNGGGVQPTSITSLPPVL